MTLRMREFQIQTPMGKTGNKSEQSGPRIIQLEAVGPGRNWKASSCCHAVILTWVLSLPPF